MTVQPAMTAAAWGGVLPGLGLDAPGLAQLPPHELAARALYGQPFGFTRAHLAALRYDCTEGDVYAPPFTVADMIALQAAGVPPFTGAASEAEHRARQAVLFELVAQAVARVEALLPPDEPMAETVLTWSSAGHELPPALTVEEWGRVLPGCGLLETAAGEIAPHALAARALYGQPFGFSRVHLAALRFMDIRAEDGDWLALGEGLVEVSQNLPAATVEAVELVAALLPPD